MQSAEWTTTQPPWKSYKAAMWACACLFMKLLRLGRIPQNSAVFHYQAHAYVTMKLRQVIDRRKAHDILEVEKSLKKRIRYRVKHAHNRPATSKVSKRWTRKDSDARKKEKSATLDKDRKRKHESRHRDESRHEKLMSREKKRREAEEESWHKEIDDHEMAYERKEKDKRESKERKESQKSQSRKRTPGYYQHDDRLDLSYSSQLLPNMMVPLPAQYQVPQFPMMQFQPGQLQYYHQFLVPPGLQMQPPTIIPLIRNVQSEERMDIPVTSMGMQLPQRPPSMGNPDYVSPLKREPGI
uniref:Uncharacterized protein n=1 Tax=Romanomermis culicivorax TaxID=13658 RepID=A0A915HF31_ROMCU